MKTILKWLFFIKFQPLEYRLFKTDRHSRVFSGIINGINGPSGVDGVYIKLNDKLGIKILRCTDIDMAVKEANYLRIANTKTDKVPKCYGVKLIKVKNQDFYRVGILMEHLGDVILDSLSLPGKKERLIIKQHEDYLRKLGIIHKDIHTGNIMVKDNKYYVIDFGPERIEIPELDDYSETMVY